MNKKEELILKEDKIYSYKNICEIRGEKVVYGKSRQLQLKRWKREFDWNKYSPTAFHITEIYDEPKEFVENRGGKRDGAGAKRKLGTEVQYITDAFFYTEWKKNDYFQKGIMNVVYVNNDMMMKYFGFYKDLYAAKYDENVDSQVFGAIADKLREKFRSLVLNRIREMPDVTVSYGIIALKKQKGATHIKDEWLEWWLQLQQEYFESKGFRNERDVIINGCWDEMNEYIRKAICKHTKETYFSIKKFRKITFELDGLESYDHELLIQYRKQINEQIRSEIYSFFLEKEKYTAKMEAKDQALLAVVTEDNGRVQDDEFDGEKLLQLIDMYENWESEFQFDEEERMKEYNKILKNYVLVS